MREHRHRPHEDENFVFKFRHAGPRGFGPGGFVGFGPGGPGRGGRRRRGDVRHALLLLLKLDGPRNGYQLMQALEERSDGRWRPSPGSVYPALSQLEDEGLITSTQVEGESGRMFQLTPAGEEHLAQRSEARAPWESESETDDAVAELRQAVIGTIRAVRGVGAEGNAEQIAKATALLDETRRKLYRLLAGEESGS